MNVDPAALNEAYKLAWDSGTVESGRLARAKSLVTKTLCTVSERRRDGSHYRVYLVPGNDMPWYAVSVDDATGQPVVSGCQCWDHQKDHMRICKHQAAVMLIVKAMELAPAQAIPVHFTAGEMTAMREMLLD